MSDKTGLDYGLFSLLNFPAPEYWISRRNTVALLFNTKEPLLTDNSGNSMTSQNLKWRRMGNLKAKIGDNRF